MIKPRKAFYAFRGFQLVDKVDKLLDGDAGSPRLVNACYARLLPLLSLCPAGGAFAPPDHALLLKTGGNTRVPTSFRL